MVIVVEETECCPLFLDTVDHGKFIFFNLNTNLKLRSQPVVVMKRRGCSSFFRRHNYN